MLPSIERNTNTRWHCC